MKNLLIAALFAFLASCQTEPEFVLMTNSGPTQGTTYHISYVAKPGVDYRKQIDSILFVIDQSMSLWLDGSIINRVNNGEKVTLDPHFIKVLETSLQVSAATDGAFDISVGPMAKAWGFGAGGKMVPDSAQVDSMLKLTGYKKIQYKNGTLKMPTGMKLDMNAIAQGYTADVVGDFLQAKNINNFLVEIGGELRASGKTIDDRIWVVGVDKPQESLDEENRFQVILSLDNKALATSGNYRKFWIDEKTGAKYSHTINPKTGYPAKTSLLSATIVAETGIIADAYATACMVVGFNKAMKIVKETPGLDAYFVYTDMDGQWHIWQTTGFAKMAK